MASEAEIRLGRLVVERGLCTQAQVVAALNERNEDPAGPELGERLVAKGYFSAYVLAELRRVLERGADGSPLRPRHEASTERNISLGSAREAIARECLNEAKARLEDDRAAALQEIRRLAEEFDDTDSGAEARALLDELGAP
ncbi:MAG: hypothetical protein D6731_25520 [Planctomycetota bacterium]|nr:MAG: hypothetical protein D6731_25520 [Planctomycetota bacterium]